MTGRNITCIGEMRDTYKIFDGKLKGKRLFEGRESRLGDNIKIILRI